MGVREIERSLEQWRMGVKSLRRRMIRASTPREQERWYAILLLAQGLTAAATAEALERDPHTIGRWASAFGEGGPAALILEQAGAPRLGRGATGGIEGGAAGTSRHGGHRLGQLELAGCVSVCPGALRRQPEQLPELPAPFGICLQTPQEAFSQGE